MRLTARLTSIVSLILLLALGLTGCLGSGADTPTVNTLTTSPTAISSDVATATLPPANPTATLAAITSIPGTAAPGAVDCAKLGIAPGNPSGMVTVGIVQIVTQPALNKAVQGVKDALTCAGYKEGVTIHIDAQNANGDAKQLPPICQKFKDEGAKVIVAVSTPALINCFNVVKGTDVQLVFNAVTDPYGAGVATSPTSPTGHENVTGVQALPPVADVWQLIHQTLPNAKKIGIIWTPSEVNSQIVTGIARQQAQQLNITLDERNITLASDVQAAAQFLVNDNVDGFYVGTDNTLVAGLESLINVAAAGKKPVFANDPDTARRGASIGLGLDYSDNGAQSGAMVVQILQGKLAKDIPIQLEKKGILAVNTLGAQQQGVTIPTDILSKADQTYSTIGSK